MEWEDIAKEYRKELEQLWNDIDNGLYKLEEKSPKSFNIGIHLLNKSIDLILSISFFKQGYNKHNNAFSFIHA